MDVATTETVQGVTLEAISPSDPPDTESLLGDIGSMYPILTYPVTEAPVEGEHDDGDLTAECREELDASIMAGLLWP
jgi:hypothetical protein